MNPSGRDLQNGVFFSRKRFLLPPLLALLCVLLTGCPHNDYTVELKPKGNVIERTLTFYRADGSNSNGVPNLQTFPSNELAAITAVYPARAVTKEGLRYTARGEFQGVMPKDVGGAGSYTNLNTSLGEAGFYVERFRGNDNLAGQTGKRFHAADQMTDLVMGWTRTQFGRDRGYKKLRAFLDKDFRNDLKNAGMYFWTGQLDALSDTNAVEDFAIRFGEYLHERGYLELSDIPALYRAVEGNDGSVMLQMVQRVIAEKMELPASRPSPKLFAVFNSPAAFEKSWTNYLARTDLYRAKLKAWEKKKKADPKLAAPNPSDFLGDLCQDLLNPMSMSGQSDQLTVTLALDHAPNHSNGHWRDGQLVWTAELAPDRPLPVVCYALWSDPDTAFQKKHFGRVVLDGDALTQYCLWQAGLEGKQASEWESFLSSLQPEEKVREKIESFHPTAESGPASTNQPSMGRKLLLDALSNATNAVPASTK